jgi:hypothetical protein
LPEIVGLIFVNQTVRERWAIVGEFVIHDRSGDPLIAPAERDKRADFAASEDAAADRARPNWTALDRQTGPKLC